MEVIAIVDYMSIIKFGDVLSVSENGFISSHSIDYLANIYYFIPYSIDNLFSQIDKYDSVVNTSSLIVTMLNVYKIVRLPEDSYIIVEEFEDERFKIGSVISDIIYYSSAIIQSFKLDGEYIEYNLFLFSLNAACISTNLDEFNVKFKLLQDNLREELGRYNILCNLLEDINSSSICDK